jgi:transposase InsO family protein
VHAVLERCRVNRLSRIDRVTGEPLRTPHPGSLIHVDVTKFGNIPDGGGSRYVGKKNKSATSHRTGNWSLDGHSRTGVAFVRTVIDDYSRLAYAEIRADERAATTTGVVRRAVAWFADHGVTVERVLSDNGPCYDSSAWRETCAELGITRKRTRPYRPQTNGKIERFHRTLADGWAHARFYNSTRQRNDALPGGLHFYNHHRVHSAIGGQPPVSRLTNVLGHHMPGSHRECPDPYVGDNHATCGRACALPGRMLLFETRMDSSSWSLCWVSLFRCAPWLRSDRALH